MDAARQAQQQRKEELLRELAEINIAEQVDEGVFLETPHYSVIERAAVTLGRQLSRLAQERAAREVAANCDTQVACPTCRATCDVQTENRFIKSIDGPVELAETVVLVIRRKGSYTMWVPKTGCCQDGSLFAAPGAVPEIGHKMAPVTIEREGVTLFAWNRGAVLEDRFLDRAIAAEGRFASVLGTTNQVVIRLVRSCPKHLTKSQS